ncbi:MAG TPA: DUF2911 domain-containing protein [Candidatus Angelobacter sp.]|jgi:hypothetical protein|nr:DUF2911 domain-containing protein [Candidatus Angelobacter sp.]
MNRLASCFVLSICLLPAAGFGQDASSNATATCNFDSSKQIAVEYQGTEVTTKKKVFGNEIPYGKVWAPGGKPMTLFANTPVAIGSEKLPIGAYTLFVIPEEKKWTLIISRSTDTSGKYDEHQDVARIPMECGQLPNPEPQFSVYFAHDGSSECNMRLDMHNTRAWIAVKEE